MGKRVNPYPSLLKFLEIISQHKKVKLYFASEDGHLFARCFTVYYSARSKFAIWIIELILAFWQVLSILYIKATTIHGCVIHFACNWIYERCQLNSNIILIMFVNLRWVSDFYIFIIYVDVTLIIAYYFHFIMLIKSSIYRCLTRYSILLRIYLIV